MTNLGGLKYPQLAFFPKFQNCFSYLFACAAALTSATAKCKQTLSSLFTSSFRLGSIVCQLSLLLPVVVVIVNDANRLKKMESLAKIHIGITLEL